APWSNWSAPARRVARRPPIWRSRSRTRTRAPASARRWAHTRPATPAPTIATLGRERCLDVMSLPRAQRRTAQYRLLAVNWLPSLAQLQAVIPLLPRAQLREQAGRDGTPPPVRND